MNDTDDDWSKMEDTNNQSMSNMDTLLTDKNIVDDPNHIAFFAPGEGKKPLSIFQDKNSEFLSFPTIYCGKHRPENNERSVRVHYSDICKWELRNKDGRAAKHIPNIFYKMKKLQIKQIQDSAMISVRKGK